MRRMYRFAASAAHGEMMIDSKEMFAAAAREGRPLRAYPPDSPAAGARLVALALLADGKLEASELEALGRHRVFDALGLSREDFFEVLFDFCGDVSRLANGKGDYLLTPGVLEALFSEVVSPAARQTLLRMIFDVIRSDGYLARGEDLYFWNAIDAWDMRIEDMAAPRKLSPFQASHPEYSYS